MSQADEFHNLDAPVGGIQRDEEIAVRQGDFWRRPGGVPHTMRAGSEGCR